MSRKRIVAIDDEPSITRMLKLVLERALPVDVMPFDDAREALAWLEKEAFEADLIICDLRMPHMDGLTFCRALKEKEVTIPIVILSAYVSSEMGEESQSLGIQAVFQKPFMPREFVERVRTYLPES